MRLKMETIELLARQIINKLGAKGYMTVTDVPAVTDLIVHTIVQDLSVEDDLEADAAEILEAQLRRLPPRERDKIDFDEMFKLIKKQLAKERGIDL